MAKKRHHYSERHHSASERHHERLHRSEIGESQMPKHGEFYGETMGARPMKERNHAMISDDRRAPANLPQHVIEKYWPVSHDYNMGYIDDLFDGVNKQLHEDGREMGRYMDPKKY